MVRCYLKEHSMMMAWTADSCSPFVGAHLGRQFEFVQSQWINDGVFFGANTDKDPIVGALQPGESFTLPRKPVRKRLQGLPRFVVTRGGEYCFMPGLRALRWLAELNT
jgi:hypothetical protein